LHKSLKVLAALVFATLIPYGLFGCAGGSSLVGVRFRGQIETTNSSATKIFLITVVSTGESDQADIDGNFLITSSTFDSTVELEFRTGEVGQKISLTNIPDDSEEIVLGVAFDETSNTFILREIFSTPGGQPVPQATPTPEPTATADVPSGTPTKSPEKPTGNFDSNGNTTAFGIPKGLKGNISAGRSVWRQVCSACHATEKTGKSYSSVKSAQRTVPDMRSLRVSNQDIANAVAYLNRSRQ